MARFTDTYLLYLLAQASSRASAGFHAQLAAMGIAVSTWRILATLYPDAPAGISELAASCLTKQPTMTRQIDRLVKAELVSRHMIRGDRRRVQIRLTEQGRGLAARLTALASTHEAKILAGLAPAAIAQVKQVLADLGDT